MNGTNIAYLTAVVILMVGLVIAYTLGALGQVNNFFQLNYAEMTQQFLSQDQISFFTTASYPLNNQIPSDIYDQMLANGTYSNIVNITRYIATTGISVIPLITPYSTATPLGSYINTQSVNSLIYANAPSNLPIGNSTFNYVYPLYLMLYSVNCSALTPQQIQQISISSNEIYYIAQCNSTTANATFYAINGIDNNTATATDALFTDMNPTYISGTSELQPLATYNSNGSIITNNTAINGTILGYFVSSTFGYPMQNFTGNTQTVYPTRNIFSGNFTNGTAFLDSLFCWNIDTPTGQSLTNALTTAGYSQFPYLYRYSFNNSIYLCLTVNATNQLLNATENIDGTNLQLNPTLSLLANGSLSNIDYIIANQVGLEDIFQYLLAGNAVSIQNIPLASQPYWFMPTNTTIFTLTPAPNYEFTQVNVSVFYVSNSLPILGQEPQYTQVPMSENIASSQIPTMGDVSSASTYLYSPLLTNITYQYQFNQPVNGTPVYCNDICNYNGSLVYQDYAHSYQYANPDFGYVLLPQINQTIYYTPQFSLIAQTPVINNTDIYSANYGQLCYYTGSIYTCQYGLSPSQLFATSGNVSAFIIYQRILPNDVWQVNGQVLTGWTNTIGYIQQLMSNGTQLFTISKLSSLGVQYTVTGRIASINPSFIYVVPTSYQINPSSYPSAQPLSTSIYSIVIFVIFIIAIPFMAYSMASIKVKEVSKRKE